MQNEGVGLTDWGKVCIGIGAWIESQVINFFLYQFASHQNIELSQFKSMSQWVKSTSLGWYRGYLSTVHDHRCDHGMWQRKEMLEVKIPATLSVRERTRPALTAPAVIGKILSHERHWVIWSNISLYLTLSILPSLNAPHLLQCPCSRTLTDWAHEELLSTPSVTLSRGVRI